MSIGEDTSTESEVAALPPSNRGQRLRSALRAAVSRRYRLVRTVVWIALLFVLPAVYVKLFTPPPGIVTIPVVDDDQRTKIYVVGWHYHTSVLVEQRPGWRLGPEGNEEARFVEFGWGDRSFMMESNYWPHALFATLFLPTESVMYVKGHDERPVEGAPAEFVYERELDGRQLRALLAAIEEDFVRNGDGRRMPAYPPVEGYAGRFYPGRNFYIFWSNCNSWVLSMLAETGLDVSPTGVLFEEQVPWKLNGFTRVGGQGSGVGSRSASEDS